MPGGHNISPPNGRQSRGAILVHFTGSLNGTRHSGLKRYQGQQVTSQPLIGIVRTSCTLGLLQRTANNARSRTTISLRALTGIHLSAGVLIPTSGLWVVRKQLRISD